MGLLNHVLVPCVFPGNPVPFPGSYGLGFTTSPGTTLIAVLCTPVVVENQPWDGISRWKLDNGDAFLPLVGTTPQAQGSPPAGTPPDTIDNGVAQGVNIYWIHSGTGGASALQSIISDTDFDMWIYEVSGVTGTPVVNAFSNSSFAGSVNSVSTGNVDGGGGSFYVAGCGVADTTYSVNAPWTLDQVDVGGGYMCFGNEFDTAAAYMTGSGIQNCTFSFADGPLSGSSGRFNAAVVAFSLGTFCGGGAQAVGNPLI